MRSLRRRPSGGPTGRIPTEADKMYHGLLLQGLAPKDAAKAAQDSTGLSVVTGKRMKTRGYGWQNFK